MSNYNEKHPNMLMSRPNDNMIMVMAIVESANKSVFVTSTSDVRHANVFLNIKRHKAAQNSYDSTPNPVCR